MGAVFGIVALFYIALIVFFVMAYWKTYAKAGQPGWACLIPVYNYLVLADIAKVSRNHVWKAMAAGLIGLAIYFYTIFSRINEGLESDPTSLFIGILVYFVAIVIALFFMFPVFKGIALNFGQSVGFAWGLMLLNVIFFAILGFGNAQYLGENGLKHDDILDAEI